MNKFAKWAGVAGLAIAAAVTFATPGSADDSKLETLKAQGFARLAIANEPPYTAVAADGKVSLIAGVSPDLTGKVKAGELVNFVAQQVGGKGGGRPDMAQAGGTQPENLGRALASVRGWVEAKL